MNTGLQQRRILVAVCGSIAAYKACELVRRLRKEGADVTVALTEAATRFVGPATFAAFTTHPVLLHQFPQDPAAGVPHVEVAEAFEAVVVAPATADILGKAAHAIADNLVSTLLNIVECPVLFVPAMNFRMWRNPATQAAVARLREWGRVVLDPDEGELATLHTGVGRFPEIERILQELRAILDIPQLYAGKRVLVSAGPTREPIDPVRYISNRSSGRMGYALAAAARDLGAEVTLVSGPVALAPVPGCMKVNVATAEELLSALQVQAPGNDYLFMAAAVADFRPANPKGEKIRRSDDPETLVLEPAPDVLKALSNDFKGVTVAFSLQPDHDLATAREKLQDKNADYIVVNSYSEPGAAFEGDTNHVWIVSAKGAEHEIPLAAKDKVAREILKFVAASD